MRRWPGSVRVTVLMTVVTSPGRLKIEKFDFLGVESEKIENEGMGEFRKKGVYGDRKNRPKTNLHVLGRLGDGKVVKMAILEGRRKFF